MNFTTENTLDVVVAAFWLVEGRRSIFKRVEAVTYSCVSVLYHALATFYPDDYDSHAYRQEIIASLYAGDTVHLDCWGLQVILSPNSYTGKSGAVGGQRELERFLCHGEVRPKQISVGKRPCQG